ncbi:MAG: DUF5811 family protein [Haloferacaceae archaeon]
MNGNTPYAGAPGAVDAGRPADDHDVSSEELRAFREEVTGIVAQARTYLPEGYAVGSEVSRGARGIEATVAVRPPVGQPVSAGLTPDRDDLADGMGAEDREEVARGLAASAALQMMNAVGDDLTPTAR